ncbi:hypothetical protein RRF57_010781 [Xylaria bambusicola]|uniref:Uncharacterized protein n=1 Tax=Xylaria bambusicola TaxID=326684 RepID=A0AAN7V1Z1_9PEZI
MPACRMEYQILNWASGRRHQARARQGSPGWFKQTKRGSPIKARPQRCMTTSRANHTIPSRATVSSSVRQNAGSDQDSAEGHGDLVVFWLCSGGVSLHVFVVFVSEAGRL